jgi:hypothetical protein
MNDRAGPKRDPSHQHRFKGILEQIIIGISHSKRFRIKSIPRSNSYIFTCDLGLGFVDKKF